MTIDRLHKIGIACILFLIFLGICFRFYHIHEDILIYYDEGMYLEQTRDFLLKVESNPPSSLPQWMLFFQILLKLSLFSNKALWFFIAGLRGVFLSADAYYFTRIVSAVFGSLSIGMVYLFAKRFYDSRWMGLLAALFLSLYPSHLYYSRLGLQETFSGFCFLAAFYLYLFPRKMSWKTFVSAFLFACVFFTNYRMIIIPFLVAVADLFLSLCRRDRIPYKKWIIHTTTFLGLIGVVFWAGHLLESRTASITIGWMFKQKNLAKGHFDIINLLSYPYYLFQLESVFWGVLFFLNGVYMYVRRHDKKQWVALLPFVISLTQMIIFSLPQEKGSRYICVVMPFIAMAAAYVAWWLFHKNRDQLTRGMVVSFVCLMLLGHLFKAKDILRYRSDYKTVMHIINAINPNLQVVSSQNMIQNLYTRPGKSVKSIPESLSTLSRYARQGYRYLVIGPQAYISYTEDGKRFSFPLQDYLDWIMRTIEPEKVFPHLSDSLLERFVLEHNENLQRSIRFIQVSHKKQLGALRIYDIQKIITKSALARETEDEE
jgi:hypothetical protein